MDRKIPTDKELRSRSYMTVDEFMAKLTPAMSEYLYKMWGYKPETLNHPEDLMVNASVFMDAALIITAHFGLGNTNE